MYNTELLNKIKNLRRHRKYKRDPNDSATDSQMWSFLIAIFAWMVEASKMTYFPPYNPASKH